MIQNRLRVPVPILNMGASAPLRASRLALRSTALYWGRVKAARGRLSMLILGNSGSSRIHLRENASLSNLRTITRYCDKVVGEDPRSLRRLTKCCTTSASTM